MRILAGFTAISKDIWTSRAIDVFWFSG